MHCQRFNGSSIRVSRQYVNGISKGIGQKDVQSILSRYPELSLDG